MIEFKLEKNKIRVITPLLQNIREHFSINDETAKFRRKGRARFFKTRSYCITPTGLFEIGMFFNILQYIKDTYPDEQLLYNSNIISIISPGFANVDVYDNLTHTLRDYQHAACTSALKYGRGILKMGTGAGKTMTICSILMSIFLQRKKEFKCLLIVPDLTLVDQTFTDFQNYNAQFKFTRWTGKISPDLTANVIIANLGILSRQFDEHDWLKDVDVLVVDECHKLKKDNKINKMVQSIKTPHKFGLTGTLPDSKIDEWNIIGMLGSIIYEKGSYSLRTEHHLTPARASILKVLYKTQPTYQRDQNNFKKELDFIYENNFRNNIIKQICTNFTNNILILVNHISHGEELYKHLSIDGKQTYFIRGEVEVEERVRIKQLMEKDTNIICIAISAIFSTGINITNIHMIMFGAGGKSSIRTIQSIGRGLRLHDNKEKLSIIDIADNLRYGQRHAAKRISIYDQEKIPYIITNIVEK
jgi:superfamily II DNA or RNA helicase